MKTVLLLGTSPKPSTNSFSMLINSKRSTDVKAEYSLTMKGWSSMLRIFLSTMIWSTLFWSMMFFLLIIFIACSYPVVFLRTIHNKVRLQLFTHHHLRESSCANYLNDIIVSEARQDLDLLFIKLVLLLKIVLVCEMYFQAIQQLQSVFPIFLIIELPKELI